MSTLDTPENDAVHAHGRYSDEEYLIELKSYHYILELIQEYHEPMYFLPDEEFIEARRLVRDDVPETCWVRVNELVFE